MLIAQLSVAGEEHTRLEPTSAPAESEDQQALAEFACDRSNLPWIIFRAAHRASHVVALPARARSLLSALARTVDAARPYAAIFARRELLTGRALQSMRTFYRSLEDLESAGLIVRPPQTRYGAAGLFGRAYLHLTTKAAELLGLAEAPRRNVPETKATMECASATSQSVSLAVPSVTVAHGAIYKDLNPITQKRQPGHVPRDLERLRTLGFRDFLIFKLMREAREASKRLSDVVEATWNHLRRATHPISYLRTLIRSSVDFSYRLRASQQHAIVQEENRAVHLEAESIGRTLAGHHFQSPDGLKFFTVAGDGSSVTIRQHGDPVTRVSSGRWAEAFVAALRKGSIVPAATIPSFESPEVGLRSAQPATPSPFASRFDELKRLLRQRGSSAMTASNLRRSRGPNPAAIHPQAIAHSVPHDKQVRAVSSAQRSESNQAHAIRQTTAFVHQTRHYE